MIGKIKLFFAEVIAELKKVSWSSRDEVIYSTIIVIITTAIMTIYIGTIDLFLSTIINILIQLAG